VAQPVSGSPSEDALFASLVTRVFADGEFAAALKRDPVNALLDAGIELNDAQRAGLVRDLESRESDVATVLPFIKVATSPATSPAVEVAVSVVVYVAVETHIPHVEEQSILTKLSRTIRPLDEGPA
jgi:hypothetical protein